MSSLRKFATPLTIAAFTVVGVTGTLWYFHIVTGVARNLHEIIGLAMMLIVVLHLILNWRAFTTYFKRPIALAIVTLGVLLTAYAYVAPDDRAEGAGKRSKATFSAVSDAGLSAPASHGTGPRGRD